MSVSRQFLLSIALTEQLYDWVVETATATRRSRSEIVRMALEGARQAARPSQVRDDVAYDHCEDVPAHRAQLLEPQPWRPSTLTVVEPPSSTNVSQDS